MFNYSLFDLLYQIDDVAKDDSVLNKCQEVKMNLAYYRNEREEFQEEFKKDLPNTEAVTIVIKKLLRHFKLGEVNIEFTSGNRHSCAGRWRICINVSQMNFAVICHEVAHTYQAMKEGFERGDHWHTKVHRKIMRRLLKYCKKKNWFESELSRRLSPKPIKPEPTKDDLRIKKLKRLEISTKKCLTKIKRYQTLIKKNNRRIAHLKKFI